MDRSVKSIRPTKEAVLRARVTLQIKEAWNRLVETSGESEAFHLREAIREYLEKKGSLDNRPPPVRYQIPPSKNFRLNETHESVLSKEKTTSKGKKKV